MSGYRDTDDMILSCGMWDDLMERLSAVEDHANTITARLNKTTDIRMNILEDMFKQMCNALRDCGVEGLPSKKLCNTCRLKNSCSQSTNRVEKCPEYRSK